MFTIMRLFSGTDAKRWVSFKDVSAGSSLTFDPVAILFFVTNWHVAVKQVPVRTTVVVNM
jgi:hypothetical protein